MTDPGREKKTSERRLADELEPRDQTYTPYQNNTRRMSQFYPRNWQCLFANIRTELAGPRLR